MQNFLWISFGLAKLNDTPPNFHFFHFFQRPSRFFPEKRSETNVQDYTPKQTWEKSYNTVFRNTLKQTWEQNPHRDFWKSSQTNLGTKIATRLLEICWNELEKKFPTQFLEMLFLPLPLCVSLSSFLSVLCENFFKTLSGHFQYPFKNWRTSTGDHKPQNACGANLLMLSAHLYNFVGTFPLPLPPLTFWEKTAQGATHLGLPLKSIGTIYSRKMQNVKIRSGGKSSQLSKRQTAKQVQGENSIERKKN